VKKLQKQKILKTTKQNCKKPQSKIEKKTTKQNCEKASIITFLNAKTTVSSNS